MGSRGPAPKRESQRRRRNKGDLDVTRSDGASDVQAPEADEDWHPVAVQWFERLKASGQVVYYEPSDWGLAYVLAENLSRQLKPRFVGIDEISGVKMEAELPINGAGLSALLKGMSQLLVTEADRRRASIELDRPAPGALDQKPGEVSHLDDARSRLRGNTSA
jgi:hypothetical protein